MSKQIWLQDGNTFSQGSSTTVSHPEGLPKRYLGSKTLNGWILLK